MKGFCNSVTITFFRLFRVDKDNKLSSTGSFPNLGPSQQIDIEQLRQKEKPQINQLVFQNLSSTNKASPGKNEPQHLILCTNYGLIVYDYFLDFVKKEESKEN